MAEQGDGHALGGNGQDVPHDDLAQETQGNETIKLLNDMNAGGTSRETLEQKARNNPQAAFALNQFKTKHERGSGGVPRPPAVEKGGRD